MKTPNRRETFQRHAMQRAEERFGLTLEPSHLKAITDFILSGQAEEVEPENGGRSVWHLNVNGQDVVVVFDHAQQTPVTFLKRGMAVAKIHATKRRNRR